MLMRRVTPISPLKAAATRAAALRVRLREGMRRRATGLILAIGAEVLLGLLLLTLSPTVQQKVAEKMTVFSFAPEPAAPPQDAAEASVSEAAAQPQAAEVPKDDPEKPDPTPPPKVEAPSELPFIPVSPDRMAALDIAKIPQRPTAPAPPRATAGPPGSGTADSQRVDGTGPNGEPLYAASWYRKPYDNELRGYLSTADGPGWGQIACKTVPDYRVEDCIAVGEYPNGSRIARAVLAAAWQFRVRPPRIGGREQVGEWVQIRIDYEMRRP